MTPLGLALAAALVGIELLDAAAELLNARAVQAPPPKGFEDLFAPEKYRQMQGYSAERARFHLLTGAFDLVVLLSFWWAGGFGALDRWVRALGWSSIPSGLVYVGALSLAQSLLSLPFQLYSTFVIEERYGFNRTTLRTFALDLAKGLLLSLAIGGPLLAAILLFLERLGPWAWLVCWVSVGLFTLFMQYVVPVWIMPLFNKFTPLEDGELRRAILDYARSVDFSLSNVFVMDGSKRSSKTNAFFTGFGRNKRIALFDTLIRQHPVEELVAVLAHEIGHYKRRHILQGLVLAWAEYGVIFFLLGQVLGRPVFFEAFGLRPSAYAGLVVFGLLVSPLSFLLSLGLNAWSRRNEFEADRYAAETLGDPEPLVRALKTLTVSNLAPLAPHPLYVRLHYSHPPVPRRVERLYCLARRRTEKSKP